MAMSIRYACASLAAKVVDKYERLNAAERENVRQLVKIAQEGEGTLSPEKITKQGPALDKLATILELDTERWGS